MPRFGDPEPLGPDHPLGGFDCGVDSLNTWLPKHARGAAASGSARTYVIEDAEQSRVVGYHALCAASVSQREASARAGRGMPGHPIPAVLLARLAVDRSVQGLRYSDYNGPKDDVVVTGSRCCPSLSIQIGHESRPSRLEHPRREASPQSRGTPPEFAGLPKD